MCLVSWYVDRYPVPYYCSNFIHKHAKSSPALAREELLPSHEDPVPEAPRDGLHGEPRAIPAVEARPAAAEEEAARQRREGAAIGLQAGGPWRNGVGPRSGAGEVGQGRREGEGARARGERAGVRGSLPPSRPGLACRFFLRVSSGKVHASVSAVDAIPTSQSRAHGDRCSDSGAERSSPLRVESQMAIPPAWRDVAGVGQST